MADSIDGFVPDFADTLTARWNHGPRVFHNALRSPLFTDRDFMTAVRGAARDYIADPTARVAPGRVYLNHEAIKPEQLGPLLPRGSEDCEQYMGRVRRDRPQDEVGIVLDSCEKYVPAMRDALVPTLHGLFSRVGYPARRNHLCIYAGTYRSTPFGIHRDDCHVLMFCISGSKAVAFWPRPYFDEKRELFVDGKVRARVEDHIGVATVLEMGPLDVLYWSADDYHVAVSDTNDFQAALSVGIYHHGSSAEMMTSLDVLADVTRIQGLDIPGLPASSAAGRLSAEDLRAPMAGFFERWDRLRDMVDRPGDAEYRALRRAARLVSSAGYGPERTRPPRASQLDGCLLRCAVQQSLVVAHARGGLLVGANGDVFFYQQLAPEIEAVVLRLRATACRFDDVLRSVDAAAGQTLTSVIRDLVDAGVLSVHAAVDPVG